MSQLQYPLVDIHDLGPGPGTGHLAEHGLTMRQGIGGPEGSRTVAWHLTAEPQRPGLRYAHTRYDEMIYHVSGSGVAGQGDRRIAARPGLCRYVPKGTPRFFVAGDAPATAVGFVIGAASLDDDLDAQGDVSPADTAAPAANGAGPDRTIGNDGLVVHLDDVAPEHMATSDGWSITDFRLPIAGHNGSGSTLFRARFLPGAIHKKHRHDHCDEIYYVISGHGLAGAGADRVEVHGGQFHYIPAGVEHWLFNLSDVEPIEVVGVYVGAESVAATGYVYMGEVGDDDIAGAAIKTN